MIHTKIKYLNAVKTSATFLERVKINIFHYFTNFVVYKPKLRENK